MLSRHCSQFPVVKLFILTVALFAFGGAEALGQVTYSGNDNTGFQGAVGESSMEINDGGTTVTATFTKGSGNFNDYMVIYIDNGSDGRSAITSDVNDNNDRNRGAISNVGSGDINFPAGFEATHAISISVSFGGLWGIPATGTVGNNGLNFVDGVGSPSSNTSSSFTFSFDWSEIGLTGSDSFSFVVTYGNPTSDNNNEMFSSNEAYGDGITGSNPGVSSMTYTTYFQYPSGDEGGEATTAQGGNWSNASTWTNGNVPLDEDAVTINHDVTLNQDATVSTLDISSGQTFTASDGSNGYTLTLTNGGALTNSGTFDASDGTVEASGSGTVSVPGGITLNDVTASTGLDFGSDHATVEGTFTINAGGFVNNNPPTYGNSSTLVYNNATSSNSPFGRNLEWKASAPGQPVDVTLQNNTFVNLGAFGNTGETAAMSGNLTINSGSGLFMDFSSDDMTEALDVGGGVTLGGTLSLSDKPGGDLEVEGDLTVNGSASLNTKERAVIFDGSGTRSVDVSSGDSFDFFIIGSSATVELGTGVSISRDLEVDGTLNANNKQVTLDGSTAQSVKGTSSATFPVLEIDNSSGGVALNTGVSTSDQLILTNGTLTTNGNLTLTSTSETSTAYISGSGSGTVSGDVTFERNLDASGDHFRFLSAPTATLLNDIASGDRGDSEAVGDGPSLLSNTWTQSDASSGDTGANANAPNNPSVFTYNEGKLLDGDDLSAGWDPVTQFNSNEGDFSPGEEGFLVFLFADQDFDGTGDGFPRTLAATGSVQAKENGADMNPVTPTINFTDDSDSDNENGWNLIANPFMAPIDWESIENNTGSGGDLDDVDATIYVWDPSQGMNGDYVTYAANPNGSSGGTSNGLGQYIAPFQAFFVKATGGGSGGNGPDIGGIDSGDKAIDQTPEFKEQGNSPPQLTLQLQTDGGAFTEAVSAQFTEGASSGKDAYDAYELLPFGSKRAIVASKMDGTDELFEIQNRPMPSAQDTIGIALDITESGTYTLAASALENLPSDWRVILKNMDSGARFDLGAGAEASFEVNVPKSATASDDNASPLDLLQGGAPTVAKSGESSHTPAFRLFVGPQAALPVELATFNATANGTDVALTWRTASETNNAGFDVQRRVEARERGSVGAWETVGFVEGAGTTSQPQSYRFTDGDVPFGAAQATYRLKQQDVDGTTTLSDPVTVQLGAPDRMQLHAPFPNPARQQATVRYAVPEAQDVQIAVYDVLGRRVETIAEGQVAAGRKQHTVRTGDLAPGVYFIRMQVGAEVRTERLSVVR